LFKIILNCLNKKLSKLVTFTQRQKTMIRRIFLGTILTALGFIHVLGQESGKGIIEGRVFNAKNNEPVPFASIGIFGTTIGSVSDLDGKFLFTGVKPGYVELRVSSVGFEPYVSQQILVTNANKVFLEIALNETSVNLDEVVIKASPYRKTEESPVSLRRIGIEEIERNPGGNRDISKVIQSFPGVSSTVAYRNDVIVRGGGPNENRFYLDDVEIPNINHFATQGASGGPVGIINVDFVRELNFYSGAFPANRGNALSSVLEFKQVEGNKEKLKFRGSIGASDMALTFDGPLGNITTGILSVRHSYLQFLFSALQLPFLPTYSDIQFKTRTRFNEKNELIVLGLGALDHSTLNLKANKTEDQRYILAYLPVNDQWNYTFGTVFKHYRENSVDTWVLSRSMLNNVAYKYANNLEVDSMKTYDYASQEAENKFRYENTGRFDNGLKTNFGASVELGKYTNNTFQKTYLNGSPFTIDYSTRLVMMKYAVFGQISHDWMDGRMKTSLGLRTDWTNYLAEMMNPLKQLSPRFSMSYRLAKKWTANMNLGRYTQLPPYTTLGYKGSGKEFVNRTNGITYVYSNHLVAGFEYTPRENTTLSLEGFYKYYQDYPVSVNDSVAIASKGGNFETFGDEEVKSLANGRAFGMELLFRSKNFLGFNTTLSYTLVRSEFNSFKKDFVPSTWDNKHLLSLTATRSFKRNWEAGFRWRFIGGAPYTPYDFVTSSRAAAWDVRGRAYLDYTQFNQQRLKAFNQFDMRVDKQYYFNKWSLGLYIDIQNLFNSKADEPDYLVRQEDANGVPLPASGDPAVYPLKVIASGGSGTVLPTVGIIVQF
jgi:hypothetical protein